MKNNEQILQHAREEFIARNNKTPEECGYSESYVEGKTFVVFAESEKELSAFKRYRKILLSILKGAPFVIAFHVLALAVGVFYVLPLHGAKAIFWLYMAVLLVLFIITICLVQHFLNESEKAQNIFKDKIYGFVIE